MPGLLLKPFGGATKMSPALSELVDTTIGPDVPDAESAPSRCRCSSTMSWLRPVEASPTQMNLDPVERLSPGALKTAASQSSSLKTGTLIEANGGDSSSSPKSASRARAESIAARTPTRQRPPGSDRLLQPYQRSTNQGQPERRLVARSLANVTDAQSPRTDLGTDRRQGKCADIP